MLCTSAVPAAAADDRSWSAAPAPAGTEAPGPDDRASFYLEGAPGTVLTDTLSVVNPADRERSFALRGAGPWIALARREVRVPARTRANVPFTVTVPGDAEPGDHSGAVVVNGEGREVPVRLALRVSGGPALPALAVENVRVSGDGPSGAVIRYALVNRGNRALAPRLDIRADGIFGTVLRRTVADAPGRLAPGRAVRRVERWADAPRLDSVTVRVTATAEGGVRASGSGAYTPVRWVVPVGGALVLGLVGAVVWLVRRRGGA
ncbi:COG1470 family protein [Streptomyces sp. URMC 124]|uniref:COG1470 family protein n=1 Tax=Streptomyces sp. URMC 124 TaxID=3423405 RepID=UPI003F1A5159